MKYPRKQIEALKWKELAEENNLTIFEMYELTYHFKQIQKLLNKKTNQC